MVNATGLLKNFPGSGALFLSKVMKSIDETAEAVHSAWLAERQIDLENPIHPFKGLAKAGTVYAEKRRVRVSELDEAQALELGVTFDKNDKRDVFHSQFRPHHELPTDRDKGKNLIPGLAVIQTLAEELGDQSTINDIEEAVTGVLQPTTKIHRELRRRIDVNVHLAWAAGEAVYGTRFQDNQDMILFQELSDGTKSYDWKVAKVVLEWILEQIKSVHRTK